MTAERTQIISLVSQAQASGARQSLACEVIGLSPKTLQRWNQSNTGRDGRLDAAHAPANQLTAHERQRILNVANQPEYANRPPHQIVPILADQGIYIVSESSFYRVLKAENQLNHLQRAYSGDREHRFWPIVNTSLSTIGFGLFYL